MHSRVDILSKANKVGMPMQSIILSICSVLHKITNAIKNFLILVLGKMKPSNVKNSGNLVVKLKVRNLTDKLIASLDIRSHYTNVLIDKSLNLWEEKKKNK